MATVTFNQANNTQLTTLGFTNVGHGSYADVTNFTTDGSNHAWMNASFKGAAEVYTAGTDQDSKSEAVIAAGTTTSIGNNLEHHVICRAGGGSLGYSAIPYSSTANTIVDTIKFRVNNAFLDQLTISPTIDLASTPITISIQVVNTVDVRTIINGTTYTSAGSGGNDHSGAAVLTGGNPGLGIQNNTGAAAGGFTSWTDGVVSDTLMGQACL